jgi:hypothetical protein
MINVSTFASADHAPLVIAIPIIIVVIIAKIVYSKANGRPAVVGKLEVRCGKGHTFKTSWSSLGSFTAIRLGGSRFQHCPVGNHWSLVKPVSSSTLNNE